jgi:hypothetical protein
MRTAGRLASSMFKGRDAICVAFSVLDCERKITRNSLVSNCLRTPFHSRGAYQSSPNNQAFSSWLTTGYGCRVPDVAMDGWLFAAFQTPIDVSLPS